MFVGEGISEMSRKGKMGWLAATVTATVLCATAGSTLLFAQEQADEQPVRVFLDCQGRAFSGCDFDLVRREIAWVDWVRDREDANVHLLVTSTQTGAGRAFDIQLIGRGRFEGHVTSLTHSRRTRCQFDR